MTRSLILLALGLSSSVFAQRTKVRHNSLGSSKGAALFTFAHITDTHIGENAPGGDFGTPGFLSDTLTGNEEGYAIDRLRAAGARLRAERPAFILHSGDITDSGERSEFLMARQLLYGIGIPYVPLMGNHDAWPYTSFGKEAQAACGDSLINVVFGSVFSNLSELLAWDDGTRTAKYHDMESRTAARLQNFAFLHQGIRFIFLDFNPRYHVRKDEPGIGPEARLHPEEGGTLPFLNHQLRMAEQQSERVVILAHHPPVTAAIGRRFAFSASQKKALAEVLRPHRRLVLGWFCGHLHRWGRYRFSKAGIPVFETKAMKSARHGAIRLVTVREAKP